VFLALYSPINTTLYATFQLVIKQAQYGGETEQSQNGAALRSSNLYSSNLYSSNLYSSNLFDGNLHSDILYSTGLNNTNSPNQAFSKSSSHLSYPSYATIFLTHAHLNTPTSATYSHCNNASYQHLCVAFVQVQWVSLQYHKTLLVNILQRFFTKYFGGLLIKTSHQRATPMCNKGAYILQVARANSS